VSAIVSIPSSSTESPLLLRILWYVASITALTASHTPEIVSLRSEGISTQIQSKALSTNLQDGIQEKVGVHENLKTTCEVDQDVMLIVFVVLASLDPIGYIE
jgi:hypothetical protein